MEDEKDPQFPAPPEDIHFVMEADGLTEIEAEDRERARQHEITKWKIQGAFLIIVVIMFLFSASFLVDVVFQLRGKVFTPPTFFIELCKIVITSGIAILGVGSVVSLNGMFKKVGKDVERRIEKSQPPAS